jgi:hypothetical protein
MPLFQKGLRGRGFRFQNGADREGFSGATVIVGVKDIVFFHG